MSWQQRRFHGRWEMGKFPLIDPSGTTPDANISSYVQETLEKPGVNSTRLHQPKRIYECPKTGRTFAFWENYVLHAQGLARLPRQLQDLPRRHHRRRGKVEGDEDEGPLPSAASEVGHFLSTDDGVVFCRKSHLRAHQHALLRDKEKVQEVGRKLRRDYPVEDSNSAYLRQKEWQDREMKSKKLKAEEEALAKEIRNPSAWGYHPTWPCDPDDLRPDLQPASFPSPFWSHSKDSQSWFLDDKTPSVYDNYAKWYQYCKAPKVAPKPEF